MDLSPEKLLVILVIALLVLGPKRLPEAGKSIGKALREFKGALSGEVDKEEQVGRHPHDQQLPRS